jgi:ribose transport system substrate-binding protein
MVMFSAHVEYGVQEKYGGRFAGYSCIAANWDANKQIEDIRRLLREGVDLLLIDPLDTSVVAAGIGEAMDAGVPVILACTRAGTSPYVGWVRLNEEARGKACADWLQHTGSGGQVVVLASAPAHDNTELWLQAVSQGLEEQPGVQGATVARCGWSWAAARVAMGRLLDSGTPVDALAVNCGVVGKGAVEAFLERGRPVPPVAGADDWNGWLRQASRTGVRFLGFTGGANLGLRCVEQAVKVLSGEPVLPYEEFPWQTFDENGLGGYYRPELSDHYWAVHDLPQAWIDRMFRPQ